MFIQFNKDYLFTFNKKNEPEKHDKRKLTYDFLTMSNDEFFYTYGFNWVPPYDLQKSVKDEIMKNNKINIGLGGKKNGK